MYLNLIQNLMFFSPFEQFDSVTWVILYFFCVMFFCIFSMSLYVALALYPLVAVISNHLDTYPTPINLSYMWSFGSIAGRINSKFLLLASTAVTAVPLKIEEAQPISLVGKVSVWICENPWTTAAIAGGVAIGVTFGVLYFFTRMFWV